MGYYLKCTILDSIGGVIDNTPALPYKYKERF